MVKTVVERTFPTPITLLPACATFAAVCEDILSFVCATSLGLTRCEGGGAQCSVILKVVRRQSPKRMLELAPELYPIREKEF